MGGPMSANDDLPYTRRELEIIGEAVSRGAPILGICLGSQLIAKAFGARVYKNGAPEIGWYPVQWTAAAASDCLHKGLSAPETVFHWHSETFALPPGAQALAYSDKCRQQAFRFHDVVYGIQFHPEITPEMILDWSTQPLNRGDADTLPGPLDPHASDSAPLARHILEGWLGTF